MRSVLLARPADGRWHDLFETADIVSEGSVRDEAGGRVWYGSTSLLVRTEELPPAFLASLLARDVHVRLRAVRTAHREACLRAPVGLGRLDCEIRARPCQGGVRMDVDVQAPLIEGCASSIKAR